MNCTFRAMTIAYSAGITGVFPVRAQMGLLLQNSPPWRTPGAIYGPSETGTDR